MGSQNLDTIRAWHAALETGPEDALVAVTELWDSDADYYPVKKFPIARPSHGRDELADFLAEWWEVYTETTWTIVEMHEVPGDRVLVRADMHAEGVGSGMKLGGEIHHCYWLRHGRVFRAEDHLTLKGALHALGFDAETLEEAGLR